MKSLIATVLLFVTALVTPATAGQLQETAHTLLTMRATLELQKRELLVNATTIAQARCAVLADDTVAQVRTIEQTIGKQLPELHKVIESDFNECIKEIANEY